MVRMMKNFMPHIITVILIILMTAIVFSLLFGDFSDMISFLVFLGKIMGIWSTCYCVGYGGAWGIKTLIDKIKDRHKKRFMWYYKMGLYESAVLAEPKFAKKFWAWNW